MPKNRFHIVTYLRLLFKYAKTRISVNVTISNDRMSKKKSLTLNYEREAFDFYMRWQKVELLAEKIGDKWQFMPGHEILQYKL